MEALVVNVWPTVMTPYVVQYIPFTKPMSIAHAIELLKHARNIPQPINTPPLETALQFPRYYLLTFDGFFRIQGVRRNLQPTQWYIVFDVGHVVDHGYWHPSILNQLLAVLESLT